MCVCLCVCVCVCVLDGWLAGWMDGWMDGQIVKSGGRELDPVRVRDTFPICIMSLLSPRRQSAVIRFSFTRDQPSPVSRSTELYHVMAFLSFGNIVS